jgi:hypothetical protein
MLFPVSRKQPNWSCHPNSEQFQDPELLFVCVCVCVCVLVGGGEQEWEMSWATRDSILRLPVGPCLDQQLKWPMLQDQWLQWWPFILIEPTPHIKVKQGRAKRVKWKRQMCRYMPSHTQAVSAQWPNHLGRATREGSAVFPHSVTQH